RPGVNHRVGGEVGINEVRGVTHGSALGVGKAGSGTGGDGAGAGRTGSGSARVPKNDASPSCTSVRVIHEPGLRNVCPAFATFWAHCRLTTPAAEGRYMPETVIVS